MNISIYEYLVSFFWFRKKFLLVVVFYWKMLLWVVTRINKLLLWVLSKNQSAFPGYLICFNGTALMKKCILTINILQFMYFVVNYFVPYDKWSGIHPCTGEHHMFCTHNQLAAAMIPDDNNAREIIRYIIDMQKRIKFLRVISSHVQIPKPIFFLRAHCNGKRGLFLFMYRKYCYYFPSSFCSKV